MWGGGGYVSLDDIFLLAMLDDVYIYCLTVALFFKCFQLPLSTLKKIQKKNKKKWSWINEVLVWRLGLVEDLVDFVFGLLFNA